MSKKHLLLKRATRAALLTVLLSVAGVTNATAQTFTVGNLNYSLNDDGVSVTVIGHVDGTAATGELVIPESVTQWGNTYLVTAIGGFSGCSGLTGEMVIPNSIVTIQDFAFNGCSGLTSVIIGNSVTSINYSSFQSCLGLTSITIPASVTFISCGAFNDCSNLSILEYNAINCGMSNNCWTHHWLSNCSSLSSIIIGNDVQVIPDSFVSGCSSLTSVFIGNSVVSIGNNAFHNCSNLSGELIIPNSVTYIGDNAFENCSGYSQITIGNNVNYIGNNAFSGCSGFTGSLSIPNNVAIIGSSAFMNCSGFSGTLTLGASLTQIDNSAFFGACANFTSINVLAENPPTLGNNVFVSANYDMPVQVPCGFLDVYQNADGWSAFTNLQHPEGCVMCTITATANPSLGGAIVGIGKQTVDFENSQIPSGWSNDGSYPWYITSSSYEGSYCMMSGNSWYHGTTSSIETTIDFVANGVVEFYSRVSSENNWDFGYFYIDDVQYLSESGNGDWGYHSYQVTAGSHVLRWTYGKDSSNSHNNDCYFIDNISFHGISNNSTFITGDVCSLNAIPSDGYTFGNWTENDNVVSTEPELTFTVTGDRELVANFNAMTYSITAMPNFDNRGSISGTGEYEVNQTCTLTATPAEGHRFSRWTENGEMVSTDSIYSFIVTGPRDLVAVFSASVAEIITFADPNVEAICVANWDTDGDGFLSYDEAAAVTDIGEVFNGNTEITSFDEFQYFTSVTNIGYYAFMNCSNLTSVVLPEGVTRLDYKAFAYSGITEITIPESLNSTNNVVFEGCEALTVMNYNAINCTRVAEYYYSWLTGCNSLTTLNIGENVQSIPWGAFRGCSSLTGELTIPESVISIASDAFANTSFTTINFNATNCSYHNAYYNYGVFQGCNAPAIMHIGENVQTIPDYLFSGHSGLVGELIIPNSVTSIGEDAFAGCSGLTGSLDIPTSVISLGGGAFYSCSGLTGELIIPASISVIGSGAFQGCSGFTGSLDIPNSVTYIGSLAFSDCTGFNGTITISENVENVYGNAFANTNFNTMNYNATNAMVGEISDWGEEFGVTFVGLPSLTTLNFGENVQSISNYAFRNLTTLIGILTLPNSLTTIGDQAFYNCYGFEGIVMGNSVETIGAEAFRNCGGISGELTLPESLVSVGPSAFMGCNEISAVNYNAINCETMGNASQNVFGDCLSLTHIRIGANVESIPNYAFKPCFLVTDMSVAAINPPVIEASTFGAISRSIPVSVPFGSGDAYRSAQYWEEFFNITEDYSPSQYTCHWNVDIHQFEQSMTAVGIIQIDGVEQTTDALEIGAFCGNECRGRQLLAYYPQVDRYLVFLTLYGEDGDEFSFRLYDHETSMESAKGCSTHLTFVANDVIGTLTNPHPFNFVDMQQTQLVAGWNWWSSYVELTGIDGLGMVEGSLGENGEIVKSQNEGYASYLDGFGWYGSLVSINNESTYLIKVVEDCEMSLEAAFASPANHPVTLNNGWNWIGYPTTTAMSLSTALSGFEASDDDLLKAQEGFAMYYTGLGWIGSLRTLTPGVGLMYKSNNGQSVTLTYPTAVRQEETDENITTQGNHWSVNAKAYPHNMNVVAVVELDGTELQDESYEIAAFANGEVRGSARLLYIEPLNRYLAFLTVAGDEATELLFSLYNAETGEDLYGADNAMTYTTNAVVGSLNEPYVVSFRGTTGVDEFGSRVSLYPNPVASSQTVSVNLPADNEGKVTVEVINAIGAVLSSETTTAPTVTVKVPETAGVYMLRISSEGNGTCFKKLVVR